MGNFLKRALSFSLALTAVMTTSSVAFAQSPTKAQITTTGVDLSSPTTLNLVSPSSNIKTTSATYFVYGTSNPNQKLYVNGTEITDRGHLGSFGFVVDLVVGNNIIEATQSGKSDTVTITRVANASQLDAYTTTVLTNAFPTFNNFVPSGEDITLSCTAPAGAYVTATVNGKTVELKQNVAAAVSGVPAVFSVDTTMPAYTGETTAVGAVTYNMTYNGKNSVYYSAGEMFTSSPNHIAIVQNYQTAAPVYYKDSVNSGIETVLSIGMVDRVISQTNTMYELSMGNWVSKSAFEPLEGSWAYRNVVSSTDFRTYDNVEEFILNGTSFPGYVFERSTGTLKLTLENTSGIKNFPVSNSNIFSSATVEEVGNTTVITLKTIDDELLWGYAIEYNQGQVVLVCKEKPELSSNPDKPLEGISVVIDPGHGGFDPGAVGISGATGANESDLNLATAIATKTLLESQGAEVLLTRTDDTRIYSNERTIDALEERADFLISIHYNSTVYPSAQGLEVYYYTPNSAYTAQSLQVNLINSTGALDRNAKVTPFRMALYTACPSVLVEMEFMSNPVVYDKIRTTDWLYDSAVGFKNGIIAALS